MYIGLPSSDLPTKSVLTSTPTDMVTPKDQQFTVPGLYDEVVVQSNLHKLVDAALNESATISFEWQGELVPNPQVPDNDTVAGHIKLEEFCCLLSSSSSSDSSGLAKSSTSPSTPNTSTDQKIEDILPCLVITSAPVALLDSSVDLPTIICYVNMLLTRAQDNSDAITADLTLQKT